MRLTLIHPCIGRRVGQRYMKTWQMEPLPPALIAGLTPRDVRLRFYDDRMEAIPFDEAADLVALSVETYTARRAYQIASEYRRRGVPVVMGGFHASLCPEEVAEWADAVVIGEAEKIWPTVLADAERGALQTFYRANGRVERGGVRVDRSIFQGKRYLPLGLVEATRGCRFNCEFCAIQTVFHRTHTFRPIEDLLAEVEEVRERALVFFVDDNIAGDLDRGKEILRALIPMKIRWVSQMSIDAAHDEEYLSLLRASGCQGVLIGFESLNPENLRTMGKSFNLRQGGYEVALSNLARFGIRLYGTFVFGYDADTPESFGETVRFAMERGFYIAAFNHLTPFPGTPLYLRLQEEGRLLFDRWWLDPAYGYNMLPFQPARMTPREVEEGCLEARRAFYRWGSVLRRGFMGANRSGGRVQALYYWINYLLKREVTERQRYPLGDQGWEGAWLKVREEAGRATPVPGGPGEFPAGTPPEAEPLLRGAAP
ncbi:MAG: B12-binding domain-containing radical SAM protein [Longimicrobiales bacterium]